MTTSQSLLIAVEVIVTLLIVWGLIHEDKLIAFEKRVARYFSLLARKHRRRKLLARQKASAPKPLDKETYNPMIVHELTSNHNINVA